MKYLGNKITKGTILMTPTEQGPVSHHVNYILLETICKVISTVHRIDDYCIDGDIPLPFHYMQSGVKLHFCEVFYALVS